MSRTLTSAAPLCAAFVTAALAACPPTYEVVGQLEFSCGSQYTIFHVNGMNDQRQVVGYLECSVAGLDVPFFWTPEHQLQVIPGISSINLPGAVHAINESGVMVGYYVAEQLAHGTIPFMYTIGHPAPIPLGAPDATGWPFQGGGWARDINDDGVIVGRAPDPEGTPRASVWESPLEPTFMPPEQDVPYSDAKGIGGDGQVVFETWQNELITAWHYQLGGRSAHRIEPIAPWLHVSIFSSNANGELVGMAQEALGQPPVAVHWDGNELQVLPTPPEAEWSRAIGITDTGVIFGDVHGDFEDGYNSRGVIWEDDTYREVRYALGPDISVARPHAMNNNGDFVASTTAGYLVIGRIHFQPADLNCDQATSFADLLLMLAQWGACTDACDADLDGDGDVGAADLALLFGAWSP